MPITAQDLAGLETRISARLAPHNGRLVLSAHFTFDRVNDQRNVPPITLAELEGILNLLVTNHLASILALNDGDTFNVRCGTSDINIPCGIYHVASRNGGARYEILAITVMRKRGFRARDPIEFRV